MPKRHSNPRTGSSFDDFLKVDGIYEEVHAKALKRALGEQLEDGVANREKCLSQTKRAPLPYGLLKGKLKVKIGFDDPVTNDLVPGMENKIE